MTALRRDALELVERIPEDKLYYVVQILEGVTFLTEPSSLSRKEMAFSKLESLRKKVPYNLDYDEELASYREERYGNENTD
ncbi:MAG: UDP-N-acetylenolpyruvoylglucosamine reductase [Lachnospiraceae bacterium]|nr:UDP-N-acetylenolpyruvoylglucosamine reductase [Lachnospiraceae bacterium]